MPQIMENPSHINLCTSMGEIRIELYWKHAPKTCKNFAELCRKQYYSNTIFHRIIPGFMVQGGDPTGIFILINLNTIISTLLYVNLFIPEIRIWHFLY